MWILDWVPFWIFHAITLAGVLGIIASYFFQYFRFIPFVYTYRIPIQIVSILLLVLGIYMQGAISNQEKWEAKVAEAKLEAAKKEAQSAEVTTKVITKYVDKVKIVKEKGDVIVQEIPKYITKESDAKCDVPNSFIVLHDSAAKNEIPDSARASDARTSNVKISGVATTVAENYGTCHEVREQLKSLQEWVREQERLYNK